MFHVLTSSLLHGSECNAKAKVSYRHRGQVLLLHTQIPSLPLHHIHPHNQSQDQCCMLFKITLTILSQIPTLLYLQYHFLAKCYCSIKHGNNKYQLSQIDVHDMQCHVHHAIDRWLVSVTNWPSAIASTVNLVPPTTVQFITQTIHLYWTELTTNAATMYVLWQNFLQFGTKFQREVPLFLRYPDFLTTQGRTGWRILPHQNQLDLFSCFEITPTCYSQKDRQTQGHS